ncbi:MAG: transposase [Okeania sp. SIO1H4]|nr:MULTISPECIES: zinc ribbon domain-containing protein [Okeania]NES76313.1 transposase [Okeania sp. SIO1H4]NES90182.1 transposase [Okeania sp. SIO2B9]
MCRQQWIILPNLTRMVKPVVDVSVIFLEDLQIVNLVRRCQAKLGKNRQFLPNGQSAKSGLNKSLQDAATYQFLEVLEYVAWKLGKKIIKVDPKGTSQHCWECLNQVPKSLSERFAPRHERHSCPKCGQELDRDYNSALLIQKIGLLSTQGEDITSVKTAVKASLAEESLALP